MVSVSRLVRFLKFCKLLGRFGKLDGPNDESACGDLNAANDEYDISR